MGRENPHGVTQRAVRRQCECCHLNYETTALLEPRRCVECRSHHPTGKLQDQVECYREHAMRYRGIEKRAHEMVERAMREVSETKEARRDALRQVAEALDSRDRWRDSYRAVMALHQLGGDGVCTCGERPCPEREAAGLTAFDKRLPTR